MPTKEERELRNEQERERYAALPQEEKEKILESHREWKKTREEKDPDAHRAARVAQIARQEARKKTDPEYAERIRKYQREQKRNSRAAKKKEAAK